jgi:hypothetical protein
MRLLTHFCINKAQPLFDSSSSSLSLSSSSRGEPLVLNFYFIHSARTFIFVCIKSLFLVHGRFLLQPTLAPVCLIYLIARPARSVGLEKLKVSQKPIISIQMCAVFEQAALDFDRNTQRELTFCLLLF